jgi:hypothetical protein
VVISCEHDNESSNSIIGGEFVVIYRLRSSYYPERVAVKHPQCVRDYVSQIIQVIKYLARISLSPPGTVVTASQGIVLPFYYF